MSSDLEIPEDCPELTRKVVETILRVSGATSGGGCKAFYTPEEWRLRGEQYGTRSILIICHDGGDLAPWFNMDYGCYQKIETMADELKKLGVFAESCTCWYTAIYLI